MFPAPIPFRGKKGEQRRLPGGGSSTTKPSKIPPASVRHQVKAGGHSMPEAIADEKSDPVREELWSEVTDGSLRSRGRELMA